MPSNLVELRPERRLMDPNFDGYKLNLQTMAHYEHSLLNCVDKLLPDDSQYSYVHAKLFALHNHLIPDSWDHRYVFFYIDNYQKVQRLIFNEINNDFKSNTVFDIPANVERKKGHFNPCISFPAPDLAFVSDGTGYLHIAATAERCTSENMWQNLFTEQVIGEQNYFVILDSRREEKENGVILHCLLQSLVLVDQHFHSVLSWLSFECQNNSWKQISIKQVKGKGVVHYAAIECTYSALYVASDNEFNFTADSDKDINKKTEPPKPELLYSWLQTADDITITLQLPKNYDKTLLHIYIGINNVKISYAGKCYIEGKFSNNIDSELTSWVVDEKGKLDILVNKSETSIWQELIEGGDPHGEQIMDASLVDEVHRRLAHLCSETEVLPDSDKPAFNNQELEECDAVSEEDTVLVRLDAIEHVRTHRIPLSVHQYLFNIILDPHEVPAIALRHDVDACIWQPYAKLPNAQNWLVKHQGTLMAFGYVQSSKQNRKFITCPQNFSYSVVCESMKHLFIYKTCASTGCELKRRNMGGETQRVNVGQQYVFNFDKHGEVLGIYASNVYLFVLTEKSMLVLEVK